MTASESLYEAGPGGICEDCGHFASRHLDSVCRFPRPADNPCGCGGMLWCGERVQMRGDYGPVLP